MKVSFESSPARDAADAAACVEESDRESCLELPARVSGGVFCCYRACLVEIGLWGSVRLGFAARLRVEPEELEEIAPHDWLLISSLHALMGAVSERFELDAIRTATRRYIAAPQRGSIYAPMLRSWSRSFEQSPTHMLRGLTPLWRAVLRHVPPPSLLTLSSGEVHVRLSGAGANMLHSSPALTAAFEGVLLGLLDLVRPSPMLAEVETSVGAETLCSICRF